MGHCCKLSLEQCSFSLTQTVNARGISDAMWVLSLIMTISLGKEDSIEAV